MSKVTLVMGVTGFREASAGNSARERSSNYWDACAKPETGTPGPRVQFTPCAAPRSDLLMRRVARGENLPRLPQPRGSPQQKKEWAHPTSERQKVGCA